jgi:hypothetical protein
MFAVTMVPHDFVSRRAPREIVALACARFGNFAPAAPWPVSASAPGKASWRMGVQSPRAQRHGREGWYTDVAGQRRVAEGWGFISQVKPKFGDVGK